MVAYLWERSMRVGTIGVFLASALLANCAGKVDYTPPQVYSNATNTKAINKTKEQVWSELIPALSKDFFVINNLDKSSGLINVSYAGDPSSYIDCGTITSYVKNARGERTYTFNGAEKYKQYEIMTNDNLIFVERKADLEGRMNIIVSESGKNQSVLTANTRYVLTVSSRVSDVAGNQVSQNNMISFNTGGVGQGRETICRPNGKLEQTILGLVN
ncbi:hypothetical protein FBZ81_107204 [Azospirillum brasilense]|nr:hypothetical protein OH82_04037 [Azospirillum brasilense]TWB79408.1 hypothetical protein FBZ81_107204 [Azospirillum brasilense]